MSDGPPILCSWDGEVFRPAGPTWSRRADKQYVIGEQYHIEGTLGRSTNSHRHFFSMINELWANLPERLAEQYPTSEHMRKYALIRTGFYDSHQLICSSEREANKVAAFIRPADEYSIVSVDGKVVTRFTAKSQSYKSMGKEPFQRSKTAILDYLSELIGTERKALETNTPA